jgi:drug/metabolite transporter (DMT)-like permease
MILTGGWRGAPSLGDVLSVGCAILFGIHLVLTSRFAARRPPVGLASTQVLMVALLAAPFAATQSTRPLHEPFVIASIVVSAVLTTAVAMLLLVWAQARVSATEAAIVLSFEPVAAAITSIAFEGEAVQWTLLAGGGLILAAMLLAQTGTLPANVPTAHSGHQR